MHVLAGYPQCRNSSADRGVLILDPDVASRHDVAAILRAAGYQTDACSTLDEAFELLAHDRHDTLIARQRHSGLEALSFTRRILKSHADVNVVLLIDDQTLDAAVSALQSGVFDFMSKSFEAPLLADQLLDALRRTRESQGGATSSAPPSAAIPLRDPVRDVLIGQCALIERAREAVRAALSDGVPVLISGEAGTEKLPVARLLHDASDRRERPFVVLHTGQNEIATGDAGRETAPGTLLFAEVSSLGSSWQMDLVKRLSELGETSGAARARIVGGLSQPPASSWQGSVLSRLFQSVGTRHVLLPALRDRGRDVLILAEHFAEQVRLARGDASLRITRTAVDAITRHSWPGNVDELRLAIQHAASLCSDSMIRVADLPPSIGLSMTSAADESGTPLHVQSLEDMELTYILRVLEAVGGNKASAARLLGVDRTTLYRKLQRQEQACPASSEPTSAVRTRR
jgi:DNA-binding NtrC family response regulator